MVADLLPWGPVLAASLAMFVVGVLDDRLQLSPLAKLVASLAIGAFLVFALAGTEPDAARRTLHTLVAIVWFAGVCHAFNLLDNMDGLAAGVALIAAAFFAWLLGSELGGGDGHPADVAGRRAARLPVLEPADGAAVHGRLREPLHRRDAGVHLARPGVRRGGSRYRAPSFPLRLILTVPLFDTAFVLVLRRLAGRSATKGGTDHVSHRLVSLGFSERSAVRILYLLGLVSGGVASLMVLNDRLEPSCRSSRHSASS